MAITKTTVEKRYTAKELLTVLGLKGNLKQFFVPARKCGDKILDWHLLITLEKTEKEVLK